MKNKFKLVCFFATIVSPFMAQFDMQSSGFNRWGRLNPMPLIANPSAIGIGNFNSPNAPLSALHINTNLVPNPFYGAGELFRTTGPDVSSPYLLPVVKLQNILLLTA